MSRVQSSERDATGRYVRVLRAPIERVWQALTWPGERGAWLPLVSRMELRLGGRVWFSDGEPHGTVTRLEPLRILRFERPSGKASAPQSLEFELEAAGEGTRLTLTALQAPGKAPETGFVAGLDCMGELLAVDASIAGTSSERHRELLAVYLDHIWQKCGEGER